MNIENFSPDAQYQKMNNGPHERPFVQVFAPGMAYHAAFWFPEDGVGLELSDKRGLVKRYFFESLCKNFSNKNKSFNDISSTGRKASRAAGNSSEDGDRVRTWMATYCDTANLDQITLVAECHTEYWRLSVIVGFLNGEPSGESSAFKEARAIFASISNAGNESANSINVENLRNTLVDNFEKYVLSHVLPSKNDLEAKIKNILSNCFCNFIGSIFWLPIEQGVGPDYDINNDAVWKDVRFDCNDRQLIRRLWPIVDASQGTSSFEPGVRDCEMTASFFLRGKAVYASSLGHPVTPQSERTGLVPVVYLLFVCFSDAWQLGRLLDTIHSMGVLRIAALRNIDQISNASKQLADIRASIRNGGSENIEYLHSAMDNLLRGGASWRIERSQRYWKQFLARVERLRIDRIEGFQPYDVFVNRRIGDTITFIESTGRQLANIRKEIDFRYQMKQTTSLERNINYMTSLQRAGELLLFFPLSYYSYMMYEKVCGILSRFFRYKNEPMVEIGIIILAFLSAYGMISFAGKKFHNGEKLSVSQNKKNFG